MASSPSGDSLLLIRCPSCGQRFKVDEDLKERTVECGGCEHRFRINDDAIVRSKKVYPGERSSPSLDRFQRVQQAGGDRSSRMQPMRYGNVPDPAVLEPASPQRIIAGIVGVAGMLVMALFLMFGGGRGSALDGMETPSRMIIAGFSGVLGIGLLVYANPKARIKALSVGLILALGLLSIPHFFRTGSVVFGKDNPDSAIAVAVDKPVIPEATAEEEELTRLRKMIGTDPLDAEIDKLRSENSDQRAIGLWLRGLDSSNKFLVRDYVLRITKADSTSHTYPRGNRDYLMVVTRVTLAVPEMAKLVAPLGEVINTYPDLSVIEVQVRNGNFVEGPIEKLSNKADPAFYELNKRELESIDLTRVKRAVQRLGEAEPNVYRADISRKLMALLADNAVDFKDSICAALMIWAEEPGPAGAAAVVEAKRRLAAEQEVPREIVALAVKEKNSDIIPVLDALWSVNPIHWESIYADVGPAAEAPIIKRFSEMEGTFRYSAVRILGKVGGSDSLATLNSLGNVSDPELRVLLDQTRKSILDRAGR